MNRKEFLNRTLTAGLGLALAPALLHCTMVPPRTKEKFANLLVKAGKIQNVRGNMGAFTSKGGSVGVFETKNEFIVIDAQYPDSIQALLNAISEKGKPISCLCNTHHHGDHTSGNVAFKGVTDHILAQRIVPELQKKAAVVQKTEEQQTYADILFDKEYTKDFSGESMKAMHLGAGHTFGDAIYHFEDDNVAHLGDLMFNNVMPVYRQKDGSNVFGWIEVLQKIEKYFDKDTRFIFGHGNTDENAIGTLAEVTKMKSYLTSAQDFVVKEHKSGRSVEDIVAQYKVIPGYESHQPKWESHFKEFITGLYTTNKFI